MCGSDGVKTVRLFFYNVNAQHGQFTQMWQRNPSDFMVWWKIVNSNKLIWAHQKKMCN